MVPRGGFGPRATRAVALGVAQKPPYSIDSILARFRALGQICRLLAQQIEKTGRERSARRDSPWVVSGHPFLLLFKPADSELQLSSRPWDANPSRRGPRPLGQAPANRLPAGAILRRPTGLQLAERIDRVWGAVGRE
jgi:hypothetical protein